MSTPHHRTITGVQKDVASIRSTDYFLTLDCGHTITRKVWTFQRTPKWIWASCDICRERERVKQMERMSPPVR